MQMRKPIRAWTDEEARTLLGRFILQNTPYAIIAEDLNRERWDVEKKAKGTP